MFESGYAEQTEDVFGVRRPAAACAPASSAAAEPASSGAFAAAPGEGVFGRPVRPRPADGTGTGTGGSPGTATSDAFEAASAAAGVDTSGLSLPVQELVAAVQPVLAQNPVDLPGAQALADTAALLGVVEQLRAGLLTRLADVDARQLHTLDGATSTGAWVGAQQTSLDRGQVALARRLAGLPVLQAAVRDGRLAVAVAERVGLALSRLRRHVDRPDGLIDGQPGEQALLGVIGHGVPDVLCQALGGLEEDDPRLIALLGQLADIVVAPTSQLARLEAAFVLLAEQLEPAALPQALGMLVDALLPGELERRAQNGHDNRGFGIRLNADGAGWHITDGELDLGLGELLHTVLQAQLAVDQADPGDTAAYEQARADGWQPGEELPPTGPRSLRQRRHDALTSALRALLDAGALGLRDKVAPHLAVTVSLHGQPGAPPAVAASGARLPAALVQQWWCDSAITRFVLSLGRKVTEASHTERTLKAHERRARKIETGGRCQAAGCRCGPHSKLIPHHADPWASCHSTSLEDTVLFCEGTHHHLHHGRTIRLKDGRWLNQHGWTDGPAG